MPYSCISLCDSPRSFAVRFGDFATQSPEEFTNADRLNYAVLISEGARKEPYRPIGIPQDPILFLCEDARFFECSMPVNGQNCAALMATGLNWTNDAAQVASEFQVPALAVAQIRRAIERQHRDGVEKLHRLQDLSRQGDAEQIKALEEQLRGGRVVAKEIVNWQDPGGGYLPHDMLLALGELGPIPSLSVPAAAVPALIHLAQARDVDQALRVAAARVLARSRQGMETAVPVLFSMALLDKKHCDYAEWVIFSISEGDKGPTEEAEIEATFGAGFPLLLEGLRDPDYQVRRRAIRVAFCLGTGSAAVPPPLQKSLESLPEDCREVTEEIFRGGSQEMIERSLRKRLAPPKKGRILVPPLDPRKPRHSQFFQFTCPFCTYSERLCLWYTSKKCPRCQRTIRMVRQTAKPAVRNWWRFWA
jgi:hypothetical protein